MFWPGVSENLIESLGIGLDLGLSLDIGIGVEMDVDCIVNIFLVVFQTHFLAIYIP